MAGKSTVYPAIISIGAKLGKSFAPTMKAAQLGVKLTGAAIAAGATAALAATVGAVTKAGELQAQMSNVGTLLDGDILSKQARLHEMQGQLLKVSNATGMVTADLTDGLYQVVSAFGDSADAAKQLEIASKSARAGNATTSDSIKLLAAVTNGYGDTSLEAMQKASDLAFQTVKLGITTYPELASSMSTLIPIASAMKGSQEDVFGAMATLTGASVETAVASTQLSAVYQGFLQPTASMTKAMKQLGYADGQVMMQTLGLQGTLDALKGSVGGNELAFANLFGSVEAKKAVLSLTGAQAENLMKKTQAMYKSGGLSLKAYEMQMSNLPAMWDKMKNYGANALTMFGTAFLPELMKIAEQAIPVLERSLESLPGLIAGMVPGVTKFLQVSANGFMWMADTGAPMFIGAVGKIGGFVQKNWHIISPILTGAGAALLSLKGIMAGMAIVKKIGGIISAVKTAGGAMAFLTNPVGLTVAAIGLLVAAGVYLYQNWDTISAKAKEIWGAITGTVTNALNIVAEKFPWLAQIISVPIQAIKGYIAGVKQAFAGVIDFVAGVFTGDWERAWTGVKDIFGGIFQSFAALAKMPLNAVISLMNAAIEGINGINVEVPDWVPGLGGKTFGVAIPKIPMLYTGVRNFPGGTALVGERGPELVNFPRGTDVFNNRETGGILSRLLDFGDFGGITVNAPITINGPITQEQAQQAGAWVEQAIDRAVKAALARIRREERRTAFAG